MCSCSLCNKEKLVSMGFNCLPELIDKHRFLCPVSTLFRTGS